MPLLERSAATLEPCSLQKARGLLSTVRSRRKLHTGFWHHGATEIELSSAWHALAPEPLDALRTFVARPGNTSDAPPMTSAFVFDFLYPQVAATLLPRLTPGIRVMDGPDRPRSFLGVRAGSRSARTYSSARDRDHTKEIHKRNHQQQTVTADSFLERAEKGKHVPLHVTDEEFNQALGEAHRQEVPRKDLGQDFSRFSKKTAAEKFQKADREAADRHADQAAGKQGLIEAKGESVRMDYDDINQQLPPRPDDMDKVWQDYMKLGPDEQAECRGEVLLSLSWSISIRESWRISELFQQIPKEEWRPVILFVAIRAELKVQNTSRALELFKLSRGVTLSGFPVGLGPIAADCLRRANWPLLADAWSFYLEATAGDQTVAKRDVEEITSLPDAEGFLRALYDHVHEERETSGISSLESFLNLVLRWMLPKFDSEFALALVELVGDPLMYEDFIRLAIERKQKALATHLYLLYRKLPFVKIRVRIMDLMNTEVFCPDDAANMELVLKDWYGRYPRLDKKGYLQYLDMYSHRGDVKSFEWMRRKFLEHYPGQRKAAYGYLLKMYVRLRQPGKVRQIFFQLQETEGFEPQVSHWNILLSAYRDDHVGAMETFVELCDAVKPDTVSFSTIMNILGKRGDLFMVTQLQRLAMSMPETVEMTAGMKNSLVDAYCYNDCFLEALDLCKSATKVYRAELAREKEAAADATKKQEQQQEQQLEHPPQPGGGRPTRMVDITRLWNTLLHHYAKKRDLSSIRQALAFMTEMDVTYDAKTHYSLLMGLALCRQAHHALHLVREAQVNRIFKPNASHYLLLMVAFLESGEPHMVLKVDALMEELGFPMSSGRTLRTILAHLRWDEGRYPRGGDDLPKVNFDAAVRDLLYFIRAVENKEGARPGGDAGAVAGVGREMDRKKDVDYSWNGRRERVASRPLVPAVPPVLGIPPDLFAVVIFFAIKAGDKKAIQDLLALYNEHRPLGAEDRRGEIRLLGSLMHYELHQGNFDNVKTLWESVLQRACELGRPVSLPEADSKGDDTRDEGGGLGIRSGSDSGIGSGSGSGNGDFISGKQQQQEEQEQQEQQQEQQPNGQVVENGKDKGKPKTEEGKKDEPLRSIVPTYQLCLSDPLTTMQRTLEAEGDIAGVKALVARVRAEGFSLSARSWNYQVQTLARLSDHEAAFALCERRLMPQWTGWKQVRIRRKDVKNSLPLALRRLGSSPEYRRPTSYTLLELARLYRELVRTATWALDAERMLERIRKSCPLTLRALTTMISSMNPAEQQLLYGERREPRLRFVELEKEKEKEKEREKKKQEREKKRETEKEQEQEKEKEQGQQHKEAKAGGDGVDQSGQSGREESPGGGGEAPRRTGWGRIGRDRTCRK